MATSPHALSLVATETVGSRRRTIGQSEGTEIAGMDTFLRAMMSSQESRPSARRASRRATSYHNFFQTACSLSDDLPPSYAAAVRHRPSDAYTRSQITDTLPAYTCTVSAQAKVLFRPEQVHPLGCIAEPGFPEWKEAYVVLQGTLLSLYRSKDGKPSKLLRHYTLQHAEVGLATDTQHSVMVPQTRLARLIPSPARARAWQRDPSLFAAVKQHSLRLRVETDQILLADASEECIHELLHAISAGIDISHSLDERSIPRQCTVPRRRRRQQRADTYSAGEAGPWAMLAEQERIMRELYPGFAQARDTTISARPGLERTVTTTSVEPQASETDPPQTSGIEEDEIDLAAMRDEVAASPAATFRRRPSPSRQTTATSTDSLFASDMIYATSTTNFTSSGKWEPPQTCTQHQLERYMRRCMPVLLASSPRASDVLIADGKRVKINWRLETLEPWRLQPPSYRSHHFPPRTADETSSTTNSEPSGNQRTAATRGTTSSIAEDSSDERINVSSNDRDLHNLDLSRVPSNEQAGESDKDSPRGVKVSELQLNLRREQSADALRGVVFCF